MNKSIFASIVICTYNGSANIKKCIESLINQNYPKDKYEILLIDDASIDDTYEIASKYPIKIIRHEKNEGLSVARNTGLKHIKGDIYICFDDDCYADSNWLLNLMDCYKQNIVGAAGITMNSSDDLISQYLTDIGHGNPSPILNSKNVSIIKRFFVYLKDMYSLREYNVDKPVYEVNEIWGENCSFRTDILKKINGWDVTLSGVEDTDLSNRIKTITNDIFVCTKTAIIFHDDNLSFWNLLRKRFIRGDAILRYYLKNKKNPPIFPFPFAIILLILLTGFYYSEYILVSIVLLPLIFYLWWPIKYLKKKKNHLLINPYIQFTTELASNLGILRGYYNLLNK